jgi:YD repeat-containing protein
LTILATVTDPDGRAVVLTSDAWGHIVAQHRELANAQPSVMVAVQEPDHREPDPRPGRERYWLRGAGPSRWLRVIVDFSSTPAEVVTAFGDRNDPAGWNL